METAALLTSTFTFGMASLARDLINTFDLHETAGALREQHRRL